MQTTVSVDKEDNGRSIHVGVGDVLEVHLPETAASARWQAQVDEDVLTPLASLTNTQTVWVLDEVEQQYQRSFRAAREGHAVLRMSYDSAEDGANLASFALEITVGNAPRPKPMRATLPAPQLVVILFEFLLVAVAAALLSLHLVLVVATRMPSNMAELTVGLLATVSMAVIAAVLALRIVGVFASRVH